MILLWTVFVVLYNLCFTLLCCMSSVCCIQLTWLTCLVNSIHREFLACLWMVSLALLSTLAHSSWSLFKCILIGLLKLLCIMYLYCTLWDACYCYHNSVCPSVSLSACYTSDSCLNGSVNRSVLWCFCFLRLNFAFQSLGITPMRELNRGTHVKSYYLTNIL